ncbi:conserved hypothetical protein [Shewanella denitrificans OS217]|uniref:DUF3549 domain-containing protein n=1 Tax=Shewanella denitrificans (strain OS217 / ATCC BAA-1090 / DSM 15013) TaxID=318161 RepID=Q12NZ7_SHEDO|nr:DUF3549 family protein [Shewanella denitrificans]ABE54829.1 conserved hypothetical protein [Shewanella denitrificans OS217]
MTEITTLSQFLTTANTQFQVYDLGRRVQHIDALAFHQIESLLAPYPYPIQGHAQLGLVFWQQSAQPYIWFLKLPLDEQGLLSPAPRSQFIQMILDALGRDLTQELTEAQQEQFANHPFSFKPNQHKLALFNALVRQQLGQPASSQYEFAAQYLSEQAVIGESSAVENESHSWEQLGLQGIADVCVRAQSLDNMDSLIRSFDFSPLPVHAALCQCLEHLPLEPSLAEKIYLLFEQASNEHKASYLAALASSPSLSIKAIAHLAQHNLLDANHLVTIAARNWQALKDDSCRKSYLEALALQEQGFFNQVFADIVAIPSLRQALLLDLRNPERSNILSIAIGGLFKAAQS